MAETMVISTLKYWKLMLLTIHSNEPSRIAVLESGQAQRDRRIHQHAEDAQDEAHHHGPKQPWALRRLKNTPKKNTTKIGGARYPCTACRYS